MIKKITRDVIVSRDGQTDFPDGTLVLWPPDAEIRRVDIPSRDMAYWISDTTRRLSSMPDFQIEYLFGEEIEVDIMTPVRVTFTATITPRGGGNDQA